MWTILTSETDYTLIREAIDENAIRGPKSVLWKLRKNPQYFAGQASHDATRHQEEE